MRIGRTALRLLGAATLAFIGVAAAIAAIWIASSAPASLEEFKPRPLPILGSPVAVSDVGRFSGTVVVKFEEPSKVRASAGLVGVVTDVFVEPGQLVQLGSPVLEVDGVVRVGIEGGSPITTTLDRGDRGRNVERMQTALASLGYYDGALDGDFGPATAMAVRELSLSIGAEPTATFDPAWLVWLPRAGLSVGTVSVQPGEVVPGTGEVLLSSQRAANEFELRDQQGNLVINDDEYVVLVGAATIALQGEREGVAQRIVNAAFGEGFDPAADVSDVDVEVFAELPEPREFLSVPSSAVRLTEDGPCVFEPTSESAEYLGRTVELGRPLLSAVEVSGQIDLDSVVVLNQSSVVAASATC